jgi:hypothetical protein
VHLCSVTFALATLSSLAEDDKEEADL